MNRVAVASTTLASVSYFSDRHLLELEFRNGAVYEYCDVPLHEYHELLAADSKALTSMATSVTASLTGRYADPLTAHADDPLPKTKWHWARTPVLPCDQRVSSDEQ
jgi:hypothetical protein